MHVNRVTLRVGDRKNYADILSDRLSKSYTNYALQQWYDDGGISSEGREDMGKMQAALGGEIVELSGKELHDLTQKLEAPHLGPVGAGFSRTWSFLFFDL